jgi:hypothetical protein
MKPYLVTPSGRRSITETRAFSATVEGKCPGCGEELLVVRGTGRHIAADDRAYESDAIALCCELHVGTIRAEVDTIFGVREDEAVLYGRPRVYR